MRRLALLAAFLSLPATAADRPNVLLVVADDWGWTDFGFMGHPDIRTPHLDRLAKDGALFPNGYTPTSLCRASLATILTGQYAHQHRICCNDPPDGVAREAMHPFIKESPGLSLLDTAAGKGPLAREAVFGEIYVHTAIKLEDPAVNLTHCWVRVGEWKL